MFDRQGLGFSKFLATGNEAGVDLAQGIAYLAEDDATDVIGVYIESIKDVAAFRSASIKAAQAGKPVVASMSSVAASGGYWISVVADKVFANPTTVTVKGLKKEGGIGIPASG